MSRNPTGTGNLRVFFITALFLMKLSLHSCFAVDSAKLFEVINSTLSSQLPQDSASTLAAESGLIAWSCSSGSNFSSLYTKLEGDLEANKKLNLSPVQAARAALSIGQSFYPAGPASQADAGAAGTLASGVPSPSSLGKSAGVAATAVDANRFKGAVGRALVNRFPDLPQTNIGQEEQSLASQVNDRPGTTGLFQWLTNSLRQTNVINLGTNVGAINQAAASIVSEVENDYTNDAPPATAGMTNPVGAFLSSNLDIEAGVALLQPFTITPNPVIPRTYNFNSGGADIRGIVQAIFESRRAWGNNLWGRPTNLFNLDLGARAGFSFGGSGSSSSSAIGTGDAFGEAVVGVGLKLGDYSTFNFAEIFGSFVSDSQYSEIHGAYGIGPAFVAGIHLTDNQPLAEFRAQIAFARVDSPDFINPTGNNPLVAAGNDGQPSWHNRNAFSFGTELRVPILATGGKNQFGYVSFGGRFYRMLTSGEPDQWSLYTAYSIPLDHVLGLIPNIKTSNGN